MQDYIKTLKNLTVLYVEDEEFARNEMITLLSYVFKEIIPAVDGLDGLNKYKENQDKIDIILSDINMPKLNGIDMIKAIKEINYSIPTVFLTAHGENNYLFEAINMQVAQFIIKPMSGNELLEKLYGAYLPTLYKKKIEEKNEELEKLNAQIIKESEEKILKAKREKEKAQSMNNLLNEHTITIEFDKEGIITYASDLFIDISGFSKEQLIGSYYDIIRYESDNDFEKIKYIIEDKHIWRSDIKNKKLNGTHYWLDSVIVPVLDENDQIIGYKSIDIDISNMRNLGDSLGSILSDEDEIDINIY